MAMVGGAAGLAEPLPACRAHHAQEASGRTSSSTNSWLTTIRWVYRLDAQPWENSKVKEAFMMRKAIWALAVWLWLAIPSLAQLHEGYLDVLIVDVKPEKRAAFDAINKKVADANRRNKGDTWVAMETIYGEGNRVTFISTRRNYADVAKGYELFMGAINKAFGEGGAKLLQDFNDCVAGSRSEMRRRRWDLTSNPPSDDSAMAKLIGQARWTRTTVVHVRTGQILNFEPELKEVKAAREKANPALTTLVYQADAGQHGTVFYITTLQSSLGGYDAITPLPQLLGEEGYRKFLSVGAETVQSTETMINRFLPQLSNPPEEVTSASPEFWRPKPVPKPKAKAQAAG